MNKKESIVALVGPSAVGKSTMLDLLADTENFEIIKQVTGRLPRADDSHLECLNPKEFLGLPKDKFWFRHGSYGVLQSEYERALKTGKKLVCIAGAFEVVQLKSSTYASRVLSVLLEFPGTDATTITNLMKARMSQRTNFSTTDRVFENLVYQDVFYSNPDFKKEYIDLSLISEEGRNRSNVKKIMAHTSEEDKREG